jgi:spermidine synthase
VSFSPALLLLFAASGCAALIYELVWFQMLRQLIGASAASLAVVLASFMGGICLGALAFPRWVPGAHPPLRVYALLEAGICAIGVLLLGLLPLVGKLYLAVAGRGQAGIALRAAVGLVCLLPPTVLMGATFPAIARCLDATRAGVARLGLLYAANIAGGVAGCLLAGFYLLRVHDAVVATLFAAALNAAAALASLALAARASGVAAPEAPALSRSARPRAVHWVIAVSGFTALAAEVVWTRQLAMVFGATVFSFSVILAVFLAGLGLGSAAGSFLARHVARPAAALGWSQLALAAAIPLAAHLIGSELPFWQQNPDLGSGFAAKAVHDLTRGAVALLPAALLWGAALPLALAAGAEGGLTPARLAGGLYAANTAGAILGAVLASVVMVPVAGTSATQQGLVALSGLAAWLALGPGSHAGSISGAAPAAATPGWSARARRLAAPVLILGFVGATTQAVPPVPARVIAFGHRVAEDPSAKTFLYVGEGAHASVAVVEHESEGVRSFHVGGKSVASSLPEDMRLQRMLGHLPALFHPRPRSVLVVGFGTGVTAGSFVPYPEVERIVVCEVEPLVLEAAGRHFAAESYGVLEDPRVEVVHDDARHFVATTRERFDVISADPIHPWMEGSATLFSLEYYELLKARLAPGGVVAQWVPVYQIDEAAVRSAIATFVRVFPEATLWSSHLPGGRGNDLVMIGRVGGLRIDVEALASRIEANPRVAESLAEVDLGYLVTFLAAYAGRGRDLAPWLEGAEINRERSLRLQYLAGGSIGVSRGREIYKAIVEHRRYPEDLIEAPARIRLRLLGLWGGGSAPLRE